MAVYLCHDYHDWIVHDSVLHDWKFHDFGAMFAVAHDLLYMNKGNWFSHRECNSNQLLKKNHLPASQTIGVGRWLSSLCLVCRVVRLSVIIWVASASRPSSTWKLYPALVWTKWKCVKILWAQELLSLIQWSFHKFDFNFKQLQQSTILAQIKRMWRTVCSCTNQLTYLHSILARRNSIGFNIFFILGVYVNGNSFMVRQLWRGSAFIEIGWFYSEKFMKIVRERLYEMFYHFPHR